MIRSHHLPLALLLVLTSSSSANTLFEQQLIVEVGRSRSLPTSIEVAGVALTDPDVADVQVLSPELILLRGLAPGATDLVMWDDEGGTQKVVVQVRESLAHVESEVSSMLPGADLEVGRADEVVVTRGTLGHADDARILHEYLDAAGQPYADATSVPGPQQVQVSVRVAEVNRTSLRTLGVNILKSQDDVFGGSVVGPSSGGPINPVSIGVPGGALAGDDLPFSFLSPTSVTPGVTLFAGFPKADFELFIQALAENRSCASSPSRTSWRSTARRPASSRAASSRSRSSRARRPAAGRRSRSSTRSSGSRCASGPSCSATGASG